MKSLWTSVAVTGLVAAVSAMSGAATAAAEIRSASDAGRTARGASAPGLAGHLGVDSDRGRPPASGSVEHDSSGRVGPDADLPVEFPRPVRLRRVERPPVEPPATEPVEAPPLPAEAGDAVTDVPPSRAITTYFHDVDGFNAANGYPPIVVTFDSVRPNTTLRAGPDGDNHVYGVTFEPGVVPGAILPSAPLVVVRADTTFTPLGFYERGSWGRRIPITGRDRFRLPATSCEQILSPGGSMLAPGSNPGLENDDLDVVFDAPVAVVGFDVLFQQVDGQGYARVSLFDGDGAMLYEGEIPQPAASADVPFSAGSCFVGFSAAEAIIKRIHVDDLDDNDDRPDANIGFDTFRYVHDEREPCGR